MELYEIEATTSQIKKLIEKKSEALIHETQLRLVELTILVLLHNEANMDTAKKIMQKRHLSKAHISKSIENLSSNGYITVTEDSEDHRILHLSVTNKAEDIIKRTINIFLECKEILQRGITQEEQDTINRVIVKINANIDAEL